MSLKKINPSIAILMATYNGSKFLSEQIDSIIKQTYTNWRLYICDDNSTDETYDIINSYIKLDPRINRVTFQTKKQGAKYTFIHLLEQIDSSYYMFSDQDDIWLEDKIEKSVEYLLSVECKFPKAPVVIHTDLEVVDKDLNTIHKSFWKHSKINPKILKNFNFIGICNCATGCTMIFNNKAKELCMPIPEDIDMHDWWITLITAKYGIINYLNEPTILYRQHDTNVVGAREVNLLYFLRKIKNLKNTFHGHKKQFDFLQLANWGNWAKFYWYKILYSILRNL